MTYIETNSIKNRFISDVSGMEMCSDGLNQSPESTSISNSDTMHSA